MNNEVQSRNELEQHARDDHKHRNDTHEDPELDQFNDGLPSLAISATSASEEEEFVINKCQETSSFVFVLSFLAAIGGFLFGYDTGVVSGAVLLLKEEFRLTSLWQELIVSVTLGTAAIASILCGFINDSFGRKKTILASSIIFTIGAVLLAAASEKWELVFGRLILGIAIGMASSTVPMYIAETAPSHLRGQLVTVNNMFITGGQLVACIVAALFSTDKQNGWRYMLGLAGVPAVIQLIGFSFMPESPRWLVVKGRLDQARLALKRIRGDVNIELEIQEIKETCHENQSGLVFYRIMSTPHVRWALFIGSMLQLFQQIIGINTVMYYSATIIKMSGVRSTYVAIWLAALTAAVNLLFTFVGLYLVERIGRRPLTLGSIAGTMCSLMVLAVGFLLASTHTPPVDTFEFGTGTVSSQCGNYTTCNSCTLDLSCGYCYSMTHSGSIRNGSCLAIGRESNPSQSDYGRCNSSDNLGPYLTWAYEYCPNSFAWMATFGLVLYLACFAPGMGPMPWTINSEIYPLWARSTGNSITTCVNWVSNLVISMTFLTLTEAITREGAFLLYFCMATVGLIFLWLFLPETKGKQLEEVETLFKGSHIVACMDRRRRSDYERLDSILR